MSTTNLNAASSSSSVGGSSSSLDFNSVYISFRDLGIPPLSPLKIDVFRRLSSLHVWKQELELKDLNNALEAVVNSILIISGKTSSDSAEETLSSSQANETNEPELSQDENSLLAE